jgi:hypothetical protein
VGDSTGGEGAVVWRDGARTLARDGDAEGAEPPLAVVGTAAETCEGDVAAAGGTPPSSLVDRREKECAGELGGGAAAAALSPCAGGGLPAGADMAGG